jgi:hypothetical protein
MPPDLLHADGDASLVPEVGGDLPVSAALGVSEGRGEPCGEGGAVSGFAWKNALRLAVEISQVGQTRSPDRARRAAACITRNPAPNKTRPSANLTGSEGFRWRRAKATQMSATSGARVIMKSGFNTWNQPAGVSNPPKVRLV